MKFHINTLHHIYNQGNNRQQVFFSDENYHFFLWKMRAHLLPFGDLVAYCLMPNHFHWLFYVRALEVSKAVFDAHSQAVERMRKGKASEGVTSSHALTTGSQADHSSEGVTSSHALTTGSQADHSSEGVTSSHALTTDALTTTKTITLNDSIGILQRSYTRAINKQQNTTGSLFRKECKAKDGWIDEFVTLTKKSGQMDFRFLPGSGYVHHCLNYLHENPKEGKLVLRPEDWMFSSARDYAGLRNGNLCNLELGRKLMREW